MTLRGQVFIVLVALLLGSVPVMAHHGNAVYDEATEIVLKGAVTEFDWANPHAQIYFDVTNDNGHVVHWGCETLSPGKLARAGWDRNSVKAGDEIIITLVAAKNGAPVGFLRKIVFSKNGKTLEAPSQ